jgi:protein phosphatase PTC7
MPHTWALYLYMPPRHMIPCARISIGAYSIPKNKGTAGEDAFFISASAHADVIGIADGVSGWAEFGIDSGKYSRWLMESAKEKTSSLSMDPEDILEYAYAKVNEEKILGSTTACIISITHDYKMKAVNLGDSGFMVIRNWQVLHKSIPQHYDFNFPWQMGSNQDDMMKRPSDADKYSYSLERGDFILLATDGLFDNLYEWEILTHMKKYSKDGIDEVEMARSLTLQCYTASVDKYRKSPFETECRRTTVYTYSGGKPDDITIVIAKL